MHSDHRDAFAVGVFGPVVAVVWRGAVTADAVAEVERVLDRVARRSREPIAFLTVAQFKAPVPASEVREQIVQCYRKLGAKLGCVAQVVEGDGFWACGARCFIAGIGLLAKRERPMSVFGEVDGALPWISRCLPTPIDETQVVLGLAELRRRVA
jgi:hypothetical protein